MKILMIRGIPEGEPGMKTVSENFYITDYMINKKLNDVLLGSDLIIGRSGYSTIMEIVSLGKKAIFIPTPGQTEQEYLADFFMQKKIFYTHSQRNFNLQKALEASREFRGMKVTKEANGKLSQTIAEWLRSL